MSLTVEAPLIVSILALLVAIASAAYSRRIAVLERERRQDELQPRFRLNHEGAIGGDEALRLTLLGPDFHYESISAVIMSGVLSEPGEGELAFRGANAEPVGHWETNGMAMGQSQLLPIMRLTDEACGEVRLAIEVRSGKKKWTILMETEVPGIPHIY
jgi:hypothetical protein